MYYLHTLDAHPPSEWHRKDGTISNINRVHIETDLAVQQGHCYLGEISADRGCPELMIKDGSQELDILVNYHERGCIYMVTMIVIDIYRFHIQEPPIGRSAVRDTEKHLVCRETPVEKWSQVNTDPESGKLRPDGSVPPPVRTFRGVGL